MSKKKQQAEEPRKVEAAPFAHDAETQVQLMNMAMRIKGAGFVPHAALRQDFGDRVWTIFSATAFRDYRIVREARRAWEGGEAVQGFEWGDRRFSRAESKRVPEDLGWVLKVVGEGVPRYKDFERVVVRCRWTNFALAANPVAGDAAQRVFERVNGHILIPAYCVRAMLRKAFPMAGKPMSLADHVMTTAVRLPSDVVKKLRPVVDERTHQGKGVTEHEALPPGTEFQLEFYYPSSEITLADLMAALDLAGRFVRFSPARSAGYGDFERVEGGVA